MPIETSLAPSAKAGRALVLGVNGQDGSYLAERLLGQGREVIGVGKQFESRWLAPVPGFDYRALDLCDPAALSKLLYDVQPDVVFHLSAVHGAAGFFYEDRWKDVHAVNTVSVHVILEYLRCAAPDGIFVYASSSKVFGPALPLLVSESSPRQSSCIYTITKNASSDLIAYYRKHHRLRASVVWTFNHESPRRGNAYFVPQIVDALAHSIRDNNFVAEIGTLGFWSDWGDAEEYMDIVASLAHDAPGADLLLATGETLWAEDFVDTLFGKYGLRWQDHLVERFPAKNMLERPPQWRADISALRAAIGRSPMRTIHNVADDVLRINHPEAWLTARAKLASQIPNAQCARQ